MLTPMPYTGMNLAFVQNPCKYSKYSRLMYVFFSKLLHLVATEP